MISKNDLPSVDVGDIGPGIHVPSKRGASSNGKVENIPIELKSLRQWVLWRYEKRPSDDKPTKVPYQPSGARADTTNPATWNAFDVCLDEASRFDGIGIVCANGLAGVDLDDHIDDSGALSPFAQKIVAAMRTYTEITPSGKGLRCLCYGRLPEGGRRKSSDGIEMYDTRRFFTVTGDHLPGTPRTVEYRGDELSALHSEIFPQPPVQSAQKPVPLSVNLDDRELIEKAMNAANGDKFRQLWNGDTGAYSGDDSSADLALCALLAFWTGGDAARIDRLFRQSSLLRPKWDVRHSGDGRTYGQMTIEKALGGATEFYTAPTRRTEAPRTDAVNALPIVVLSSDHIMMTNYPEPVWAVPNLLPVGLTILAGAPKIGKSWLALQIAYAVAAGGFALGERVARGAVLYLALEDSPRRLRDRMLKQNWTRGLDADFLTIGEFAKQVGDLKNDGGAKLARQIEARGYRLVVIDTLSRAIPGDQNDVWEMTRGLTPLQEISHAHNTATLLIDHHRKLGGSNADVITDILGSTAKGAMCDTSWGLYRERGKVLARLAVTGREISERNLALKMDWERGFWSSEGDADALALTERRQEILDALRDMGKVTLAQVAQAVGQDRSNTHKRLVDLVSAGKVKHEDNLYFLS